MQEYVPPSIGKSAFHCPRCGAYAHHDWSPLYSNAVNLVAAMFPSAPALAAPVEIRSGQRSLCTHCGTAALWVGTEMVYPSASPAPLPSPDMPDNVATDFNEARDVLARSPRSAAALLRLALQKLMKHLNLPGNKLDDDIGALVKRGLRPQVQQALDILRVIGNNAVHPGELDMRDDFETATTLFKLVNLIVEEMISQPREIEELYGSLPEGARQAIEKRDTKPAREPRM